MATKKKDRDLVFQKYGGRCAFCGTPLSLGWHVWDIEPIGTAVSESGSLVKTNTEIENLMPACKSCGSTRSHKSGINKMNIEAFRQDIMNGFLFLKDAGITAPSYKKAVKFGLLIETYAPVIFYFEK